MGQTAVCPCCVDKEKDQQLTATKDNDLMYTDNKSLNLMENPILKSTRDCCPLRLSYFGANTTSIQEGFGIVRWSNDCEFRGEFHKGVPNGWGIFTSPDNGVYQGEYENDKPNGFGIYMHITNSSYEGYWYNEKQDGYGIEVWKDGAEYKGEFSQGKKNGVGIYIFPNKNIYLGEWEQNKMNGYGIYCYENKFLYCGEWLNGLRDGYGEIYGPKNTYYFGFFKNNVQNGFFMFYNSKSKKIIVGYNINGKIDGIAKYFKKGLEGKLIVIKFGKRIKEMTNEDKINDYLNNSNNFEPNHSFVRDKQFNHYFYMNREELENILLDKIKTVDYDEIINRIHKGGQKNKNEILETD